MGGGIFWAGGWVRGCGYTLLKVCSSPHSKMLWNSSMLCDAGLVMKSNVCILKFSFLRWLCDSENEIHKIGKFSYFWIALLNSVWFFCSTLLNIDPNFTCMYSMWLFLLLQWYVVGIPSSSTFWKTKYSQKVRNFSKAQQRFFTVVSFSSPTFTYEFVSVKGIPKMGWLRRGWNITLLGEKTGQARGSERT